ncbi:MAG: hypothetical protein EXX96DRAFT_20581 [Benjaminiella poitrasii]|nr:MAG: hypothetical protein EXX96DRAFT_20581 [Benjaminiella poitrasii]
MLRIGAQLRQNIKNDNKRYIHLHRHSSLIRLHAPIRPKIAIPHTNTFIAAQQRSISIIPTIVRTAFRATRLPLFLTGTALAGASVANDKLQDLANKGTEFMSDIKHKLSSLGKSIEDVDIKIPEMNIKLSDLLRDVLKRNKNAEETSSVNHTYNAKTAATQEEKDNTTLEPIVKIEEKEETMASQDVIEEEELIEDQEDIASRMKYQDQQFLLLCKKFANIRSTLLSIHHPSIPAIPSMVIIGPRHSNQTQYDTSIIIDSILGQHFSLTREMYDDDTIFEIQFANHPDLKEPKVQLSIGQQTETNDYYSLDEVSEIIKQQLDNSKDNKDSVIRISIFASDVPFLNLYDLPEKTDNNATMYEKYIKQDPQAIIMAVYDTSVPLKENSTLKICEKYDPLGRRTVGILAATKHNDTEEESVSEQNETVVSSTVANAKQRQEPSEDVISISDNNKNDYDYHLSHNLLLGYIDTTNDQETDEYKGEQHRLVRHQLFGIIEQSMGRSIYSVVNSIKSELEETRYVFKVVYNDRELTAMSYLTDTMNELKRQFKSFSNALGKPQLRSEVRHLLVEQNVLNICAEQYWSDPKILDLTRKGKSLSNDFYWLYKLDLASAAMTKSGIGRLTTQVVIDVIMRNMERLVRIEPLEFHPRVQKKIVDFTGEMLGQRFSSTSDQVENTIKPYKYEVEVTEDDWKDGTKRTIKLLEKELSMCEGMLWTLKKNIGRKRLRSAIRYVLDNEKTNHDEKSNSTNQQKQVLIEKAKGALFLQDRAMVLKYRLAALKSQQCRTSENKQFCPEIFLNIVAEKLTYTAVMFIQVELLNEFFFNFPVDVLDDRIVHPMSSTEVEKFAKENPVVEKHLILQDRKRKLEEVMDMLNYLVKRHEFRRSSREI